MPKLGIGLGIASNKGGALKKLLGALYLQPSSVLDNVSPGALIATVQGTRAGSSLTLTGNAAGMFTLTGDEVFVAGDLDYATAQSHQIEVTETNAAYPNSPRASALTINVLDSTVVTLSALTLSAATISEGAASGATVGALQGATGGSTLSLVDDAGGRFAIASGSIVAGLTGLDYETATSHQITVRETHPNATNSPRDTVLTISVTNVADVTLAALTLSASTISEGAANGTTVGQVQGTTAGSTLSLLDSAGGLFALNAGYIEKAGALDYETATSHSITIRETHPDAAAPRDTVLSLTVSNVLEVTLAPLTLSAATLAEGAAENTVVGAVQGKSTGSTLTLFDDAGGRFKLTGTSLVAGPTATDYSVATSHSITLRETHPDAIQRDTVLAISITEVVVVDPGEPEPIARFTPASFNGTTTLSDEIGSNHLTLDGPVPTTADGMLTFGGSSRFRRTAATGLPTGTATVTKVDAFISTGPGPATISSAISGYGVAASGRMAQVAVRGRRYVALGFGTSSDVLTPWGTALGQPVVVVSEFSATGRKVWANDVLIHQDAIVINKGLDHMMIAGPYGGSALNSCVPMKLREQAYYTGALTDAERAAITTRLLGEMPTVAEAPLEIITGQTFLFTSASETYQTINLVNGAVGALKLTYTGNTSGLATPPFSTLTGAMEGADGTLTIVAEDLAGRTDTGTLAIDNVIPRPVPKAGPALTVKTGQSVRIFFADFFSPGDEGDTPIPDLPNCSAPEGTLALSDDGLDLIYTAGSTVAVQALTLRAKGSTTGYYTTITRNVDVQVFEPTIGEAVINPTTGFAWVPYDAGDVGSALVTADYADGGTPISTSITYDIASLDGSVPIQAHPGGVDGGLTAGSVLTARYPVVVSRDLPTSSGQWVDAAAADAALQTAGVLQHTRAAGQNPEFPLTVTNAVGALNRRLTTGLTEGWGGEQLVALNGTQFFAPTGVTPDASEFFGYGVFVRGPDLVTQTLFQMGNNTSDAPYAVRVWLNGGTRLNVQFYNGTFGANAFYSASTAGAQALAEGERIAFFIRVKLDGVGGGEMIVHSERLTSTNVRSLLALNDAEAVAQPLKFADFETRMFRSTGGTQLWTSPFAVFGFWLDPAFDMSNLTTLKALLVDMDTPLANGQSGALASGTLTMKDPASWLPTLGQPTRLVMGPAADINAGIDAGSAPNFALHEPDNATDIIEGTTNPGIQSTYGATGDGVTNDSAAFLAFQADYVDDPDPVTLDIEPGSYVQGAHWMQGIDNLTVQGGPATFADNRRVGTSSWQRQTAMHSLRLEPVAAGATVLTVKNVDPATLPVEFGDPTGNPNRDLATLMALVAPGDWVMLSAWDTMGFGYPTNPQMFEYAQVASVGASAITLTAPTKYAYSDAFPVYWNGATLQQATNISGLSGTFVAGETVTASGGATGLVVHSYPSSFNGATNGVRFTLDSLVGKTVATGETLTGQTSGATATVVQTGPNGLGGFRNFEADQAGPATLHVLDRDWDTEITLRDLTWATLSNAQVGMAGRSLTFENVDFTPMTAPSNSLWPSGAKDLSFIDCDMNTPEHDKLIETLTIRGGSAATHIVQSASIDRMVLQDHTCNNVNGTARSTELRNVTAANAVRIGPLAYGRTDSVLIENSSAATLDWSSRAVLLADVTFNAGVFSKSDPNPQGVASFGQEWAVPGTKIALANSAGQVLDIATITAFSESGGTASVTTDLSALPAGADRIYPHPCWDVTASGNTGALAVLNGSVNQPLFSRGVMAAAGSMTLWGGLTELRVNVTGTYTGNMTISGPAYGGTWTATVNLNTTGERVIAMAGNTGTQAGDALPEADWFQGAFTVTAGGGTFTITATTDQTAALPVEEVPAATTSPTVSVWMLDEASGSRADLMEASNTMAQIGTVGTTTLANGMTAAHFPNGAGMLEHGIRNGLNINGAGGPRSWTIHGWIKFEDISNGEWFVTVGTGAVAFELTALMRLQANKPEILLKNGSYANAVARSAVSVANNELVYLAAQFNADTNQLTMKRRTYGSGVWDTTTTAVTGGPGFQLYGSGNTKFRLGGKTVTAEVAMAQWAVTREHLSEAELDWYFNEGAGRTALEISERVGTWPAMQEVPTTQQSASFITSAETNVSGTYWLRPYRLADMDTGLAGTLGNYVWVTSSDHSSDSATAGASGIAIGYSSGPSVKPASWSRIWASPNQGVAGYSQSETPCLVYNPDDANGRPFYLYLQEITPSQSGYTWPQETRLLSSANLSTWTNEGIVLAVNTGGRAYNHKGYAMVVRKGTSDWEAWHLTMDGSQSHISRSTSTDGKAWTADIWATNYYKPLNSEQWTPPGYRTAEVSGGIFTIGGIRYALSRMDVSGDSERNPDIRHVVLTPLNAGGWFAGPPIKLATFEGTWPGDGYLQSIAGYLEGTTLHFYPKMRFQAPDHVQYWTADVSGLV